VLPPSDSLQDGSIDEHNLELAALLRQRDLADELLHTRQIEPLGETLQRRLAMAERICREFTQHFDPSAKNLVNHDPAVEVSFRRDDSIDVKGDSSAHISDSHPSELSDAYWVAEIECRTLNEMLNQWLAWLRRS
jgi:hypothetical protein